MSKVFQPSRNHSNTLESFPTLHKVIPTLSKAFRHSRKHFNRVKRYSNSVESNPTR
jgi:hypothetical protein